MPWFVAVIPLIAGGVAAYSAIKQGEAASAASKFNQTVADQNASIARQEAMQNAAAQDRENYLRKGAIRAAQGAGGGAQEGSVLDVLGDAASEGEFQKQQFLYKGELNARGYKNTSNLEQAEGRNAKNASYMQAGSALLGGASDYDKLRRAG